jgi:hypothetical protein
MHVWIDVASDALARDFPLNGTACARPVPKAKDSKAKDSKDCQTGRIRNAQDADALNESRDP